MSVKLSKGTIALYVLMAFYHWQWNPEKWSIGARGVFVMFWLLIFVLVSLMEAENSNKKQKGLKDV